MPPFPVGPILVFTLLPLPTPARPVPPPKLVARQSHATRTDGDLIFNIVFSLALLIALLGSFAWLATGRSFAQLVESFSGMYTAGAERLSDFRISSLLERTAATTLNATDGNTANTPRTGGASPPMAAVPWNWLQSGGFGGTQGGSDPPAFTPST